MVTSYIMCEALDPTDVNMMMIYIFFSTSVQFLTEKGVIRQASKPGLLQVRQAP